MIPRTTTTVSLLTAIFADAAFAHEHHGENIPEGSAISPDPLDGILWLHIFVMCLSFGVLFPTGMVLGIVRSRWHVPTQILASSLAVVGYFLGHAHKGRQFSHNVHAAFANWVMLGLVVQVVMGVYLKLHWEKGWHGRMRKWVVLGHGAMGKAMPIINWIQMLFGGITALGFCRADHMGQCLAHFIMGSSFIAYAIIMTILLLVGQLWIKRSGRAPEFWDSLVIACWGCVNTFTEHRWGHEWAHNDIQHTSMGIVWWAAGLLGLWLSKGTDGKPRRNLIPAVVIFLTGWAMSSHPQHLHISTMVHTSFGYTLMAAGLSRLIEIAFVLKDSNANKDLKPSSFQYLPPYLLVASGFIFMGATEEQMGLLASVGIDHVSYLLVLYSLAFLMFLFVNSLIYLYSTGMDAKAARDGLNMNPEDARARGAEEFELEGLISDADDEEDDHHHHTSGTNGAANPRQNRSVLPK